MKFINSYKVKMKSTSILRVCGEDSMLLINPLTQNPLIQGSSLAGAMRDYLSSFLAVKEVNDFMGGANAVEKDGSSQVYISDALGDQALKENRTQISIDSKRGTAIKGNLTENQYLTEGISFSWNIKIFADSEMNLKLRSEYVEQFLSALHHGLIKLGSKKTSGAGAFEVESVDQCVLDLSVKRDLMSYLTNQMTYDPLHSFNFENFEYPYLAKDVFEVTFEMETPMLIAGETHYNPSEPDRSHIKTLNGDLIVPGSSLKGVLKNQCIKIASYFGVEDLPQEIFGEGSNKAGRLYFTDSNITTIGEPQIYNRIHLDCFTGGVMAGALVEEKPVMGYFVMKCSWDKLLEEMENKKAIGLILLALKDLADGSLSLGSGFSIGRGRLKAKAIYLNGEIVIDFEKGENHKALTYVETLNMHRLER